MIRFDAPEASISIGNEIPGLNSDLPAPTAQGESAMAIGNGSAATAKNATALGAYSNAAFVGATAIGTGATATAIDQVALGGPGSAVRIGDLSASTASQNAFASLLTADSSGVVGRLALPDFAATASQLAALGEGQALLNSEVGRLFDLRSADRRNAREGIAVAVAMGTPAMPSAPGRTSYSVNVATFRGERAMAASLMHRLGSDNPVALSGGISVAGHGNTAARVGVAGEF
jgi:autotransporter adhesin